MASNPNPVPGADAETVGADKRPAQAVIGPSIVIGAQPARVHPRVQYDQHVKEKFMTPRVAFTVGCAVVLSITANTALAAAACDASLKLTPSKEFTAVYDTMDAEGKNIGQVIRKSWNFGRDTLEDTDLTLTIAGFADRNQMVTRTRCDKMYFLSEDGASAQESVNPMWQSMADVVKREGLAGAQVHFATSMGQTASGETCNRAGLKGTVYASTDLGLRTCMNTEKGIAIESSVNMGSVVIRQVLREFSDSAGPLPPLPAKITQGLDLSGGQGLPSNANADEQESQIFEDAKSAQEHLKKLQEMMEQGEQTQ